MKGGAGGIGSDGAGGKISRAFYTLHPPHLDKIFCAVHFFSRIARVCLGGGAVDYRVETFRFGDLGLICCVARGLGGVLGILVGLVVWVCGFVVFGVGLGCGCFWRFGWVG